jgi:hypothetical protein
MKLFLFRPLGTTPPPRTNVAQNTCELAALIFSPGTIPLEIKIRVFVESVSVLLESERRRFVTDLRYLDHVCVEQLKIIQITCYECRIIVIVAYLSF